MNLTNQKVYEKPADSNDDAYLAWLRKQKSAFSGKRPCEACHFRTAANSGVGIKPLFSAIPLTHDEHLEQHRIGTFKFASRSWWESQCAKHLERWKYETKATKGVQAD